MTPFAPMTAEQWDAVKRTYGNRCAYCGAKGKMTQDHVIPLSLGGTHTVDNVVPACRSCNSAKRDRPSKNEVPVRLML